jgi:hypothetical protein
VTKQPSSNNACLKDMQPYLFRENKDFFNKVIRLHFFGMSDCLLGCFVAHAPRNDGIALIFNIKKNFAYPKLGLTWVQWACVGNTPLMIAFPLSMFFPGRQAICIKINEIIILLFINIVIDLPRAIMGDL